MKAALLLLVALSLIAPAPVQDEAAPRFLESGDDVQAFFASVEERMRTRRTVAARFEQVKVLALFDQPLRTSGVILYARPDKLRWEIQEPFRSLLVVAGNDVAKFEYSAGERRPLELGRAKDPLLLVMGEIRGWFRGRFSDSGAHYDLRVAREPQALIELTPKGDALKRTLASIRVTLTKELDGVRRVVLEERGGDRTTMNFEEAERDVALDEGWFRLDDPRDLDFEALLRSARAARAK